LGAFCLLSLARRAERSDACVTGYRNEINDVLDRIAAIEEHLGLNQKIAA
jgi:hypothetical protein